MSAASAHQQVILITGTSSGFGRVFATESLARGHRVIATARKLEAISDLKELGAAVLQLDVTSTPKELEEFAKSAVNVYGRVDILINNAGYSQAGPIEETSAASLDKIFQTNFFGAVNVTKAFLPYLRKQGSGTIVNISSIVSDWNAGGLAAYAAAKGALNSWSDCLKEELKPFGVHVLTVQPNAFKTNVITSDAFTTASKETPTDSAYSELHQGLQAALKYQATAPEPLPAIKRVLDLVFAGVKGEVELPARLALGNGADDAIKGILQQRVASLETFKKYTIEAAN